VYEVAAAYAFHLAESQAYFDGNKRTGVEAALVFLEGSSIDASQLPEQQTYNLMIRIAAHKADRSDFANYLRSELGRERTPD
jgi:death-on-curing protein